MIVSNNPPRLVAQRQQRRTLNIIEEVSRPSLENLAYCLRHPDTWPEGFYWDYGKCERCAMGLAHELWSSIPEASNETGASIMARAFHMSYEAAHTIFFGSAWRKRKFFGGYFYPPHSTITPSMVADAIDKYLANTP